MIDPITGAIIGVGSQFLGGLMGHLSQQSANRTNQRIANQNLDQRQREFAWGQRTFWDQYQRNDERYHEQMRRQDTQLQRHADDARAAGINPMAAMGINPASGPSIQMSGTPPSPGQSSTPQVRANMAMPKAIQRMGAALADLRIEKEAAKVENIRAQTKKTQLEAARTGIEQMPVPSAGFTRTKTGLKPTFSEALKQRVEETPDAWVMWPRIKTTKPSLGIIRKAFPGAIDAKFNFGSLEWRPVYSRKERRKEWQRKMVPYHEYEVKKRKYRKRMDEDIRRRRQFRESWK